MSEVEKTTEESTGNDFVDEEQGKNTIPVFQQLSLLAVVLLLIFGTALSPTYLKKYFLQEPVKTQSTQSATVIENTNNKENQTKAFEDVSITGKAAYVWDINNQRVLFKKNEGEQLPLASVTKLMTALVAQELMDENDTVSVDETALRQDGDSGLLQGETFQRMTLNDMVLMSSSNDGAYALASAAGALLSSDNPATAFVHAMNIRAQEIGLHETYFKNPTGLDISKTDGGAYGSARDMAFLMEYIVLHHPDLLTYTTEDTTRIYDQTGEFFHDAENTNYYIDSIPGIIGSKTGYTDLAGGNLVVAFDAGLNRPIVVSVLGSTYQDRFLDVLALVSESQKYVEQE